MVLYYVGGSVYLGFVIDFFCFFFYFCNDCYEFDDKIIYFLCLCVYFVECVLLIFGIVVYGIENIYDFGLIFFLSCIILLFELFCEGSVIGKISVDIIVLLF